MAGLNPKRELFCKIFATEQEFFGNGTQSYIKAYNIDVSKKGAYAAARTSAYELLTNPDILKRIDELLETAVLNDQFVDKQIALLISQNAEYSAKIAAIKEYNALKQRIVKKIDHTTGGRPFGAVITELETEDARFGTVAEEASKQVVAAESSVQDQEQAGATGNVQTEPAPTEASS